MGTELGRMLREARGDTSLRAMAARCGVHFASLARYESGRRIPRGDAISPLAEGYGIPLDELCNAISATSEEPDGTKHPEGLNAAAQPRCGDTKRAPSSKGISHTLARRAERLAEHCLAVAESGDVLLEDALQRNAPDAELACITQVQEMAHAMRGMSMLLASLAGADELV